MIRVLQIGMTDNLGGIETFLMNYYRNIDRKKIQFDFINIYDNNLCFHEEINSLGGKIYKVSSYYKHPIKYIKEVSQIIKKNKYQIVHCNMNSAVFLYPLIAAKKGGAKVIIAHSHNSSSDKGFVKTLLHNINKTFLPLFANTFFACSNRAGEWFYNRKIRKSSSYYIIKNAINVEKYLFNEKIRSEKRKELDISEDVLVIGHVGRFNKQKNHTFLIDIFYEYQKKDRESKLILIGIGPLKKEIKNKVEKLKIQDKVLFLEHRDDVNEMLQAMDIFILPSLYEGLPLAGIEAQASGLTCLFSQNITQELKISDNANFIKNMYNTKEWVIRITKNRNRNKNDEKIKNSSFSIKKATADITKIYNELLKGAQK